MAYKKYRISSGKLAVSLILMFVIGFLVSYNISSFQHGLQTQNTILTQQQTPTASAITVPKGVTLGETSTSGNVKIVAVNQNGDGVMGDVNVQIVPGNGQVLVDISPFVEPDTQYSALTAVKIAEQITKTDLQNKNTVISFNVNGTVVGGPSAGAAIAIATISAIENKPIKSGGVVTGTIETDGTIGKVGGIVEKGTQQ